MNNTQSMSKIVGQIKDAYMGSLNEKMRKACEQVLVDEQNKIGEFIANASYNIEILINEKCGYDRAVDVHFIIHMENFNKINEEGK